MLKTIQLILLALLATIAVSAVDDATFYWAENVTTSTTTSSTVQKEHIKLTPSSFNTSGKYLYIGSTMFDYNLGSATAVTRFLINGAETHYGRLQNTEQRAMTVFGIYETASSPTFNWTFHSGTSGTATALNRSDILLIRLDNLTNYAYNYSFDGGYYADINNVACNSAASAGATGTAQNDCINTSLQTVANKTYAIMASYSFGGASTALSIIANLRINGVDSDLANMREEPRSTTATQTQPHSFIFLYTPKNNELTNISLRFYSSGTTNMSIQDKSLVIVRISDVFNFTAEQKDGTGSTTNSTPQTLISQTTPAYSENASYVAYGTILISSGTAASLTGGSNITQTNGTVEAEQRYYAKDIADVVPTTKSAGLHKVTAAEAPLSKTILVTYRSPTAATITYYDPSLLILRLTSGAAAATADGCACPASGTWYVGGCTISGNCVASPTGSLMVINGTTTVLSNVTITGFFPKFNYTTSILKIMGILKASA